MFQCVRISWVMPSRSPKDREGRRVESSDPLCNWTQFLFFFRFTVQRQWNSSGLQGFVEAAGAFPKGPHGREAQGQLLMRTTWMLMLIVMDSPSRIRHHLVSLVSIARHVRDKWLGNGRRSGSEESLSEIAFRNLNFLAMN